MLVLNCKCTCHYVSNLLVLKEKTHEHDYVAQLVQVQNITTNSIVMAFIELNGIAVHDK